MDAAARLARTVCARRFTPLAGHPRAWTERAMSTTAQRPARARPRRACQRDSVRCSTTSSWRRLSQLHRRPYDAHNCRFPNSFTKGSQRFPLQRGSSRYEWMLSSESSSRALVFVATPLRLRSARCCGGQGAAESGGRPGGTNATSATSRPTQRVLIRREHDRTCGMAPR